MLLIRSGNRHKRRWNTNLLFWLLLALVRRRVALAVLALTTSYAIAWIGHFFVERNVPLTLRRPILSALYDMRMYLHMWTGTMKHEVARHSVSPELTTLPGL